MKAHPLEKHLAECLAEWKMYIKMLKAFLPHKGPNNHRVELGVLPMFIHTQVSSVFHLIRLDQLGLLR